jgi:outer membrane protein insertion porin family
LTPPVNEKHTGGAAALGFTTSSRHRFFADTSLRVGGAVDDIRYEGEKSIDGKTARPRANITGLATAEQDQAAGQAYNSILSRIFDPGVFGSWSFTMGKDTRNHPMHPTMGYSYQFKALAAYPIKDSHIGFAKTELDAHWYTPLIGDYDLILHAHGYVGWVHPLHDRNIPYRELFHIGGQASVRGFGFGQIGPQFTVSSNDTSVHDSIGGSRTFYMNVEFIFPVLADFSIKGLFFYDGGAGWKNPYSHAVSQKYITSNHFDYRHSVGIGVRMLNPMPIRIDWGFKLDPRERELGNEVHFSMSYDW